MINEQVCRVIGDDKNRHCAVCGETEKLWVYDGGFYCKVCLPMPPGTNYWVTRTQSLLQVIQPGTKVDVGPSGEKFDARVTAVCVRETGSITYEVSWWDGRTHKEKWLTEEDIDVSADDKSLRIGFLP